MLLESLQPLKSLLQDDPEVVGEVTKKLYGDLCSQLPLSSLLPCLVDLCRSLCGIMQSYKSIYNWHVNQDSSGTQEYVLKKLSNGFPRIWQDVQTKVHNLFCFSNICQNFLWTLLFFCFFIRFKIGYRGLSHVNLSNT